MKMQWHLVVYVNDLSAADDEKEQVNGDGRRHNRWETSTIFATMGQKSVFSLLTFYLTLQEISFFVNSNYLLIWKWWTNEDLAANVELCWKLWFGTHFSLACSDKGEKKMVKTSTRTDLLKAAGVNVSGTSHNKETPSDVVSCHRLNASVLIIGFALVYKIRKWTPTIINIV